MASFILRVIVNAAALWVASWVLPGMDISSAAASDAVARTGISQDTETIGIVLAYLFIGLLFAIVINAAMLYLTAWISSYTPVHLTIDSFFWTALLAAIIISLVSLVAGLLPGGR